MSPDAPGNERPLFALSRTKLIACYLAGLGRYDSFAACISGHSLPPRQRGEVIHEVYDEGQSVAVIIRHYYGYAIAHGWFEFFLNGQR